MKRVIALFIFILSLFVFVSCEDAISSDGSTVPETEPARDIVFAGGDVLYSVIRPDKATEAEKDAAVELYGALRNCNRDIQITTDWIKEGDPIPAYEILVGNCDRDEVTALSRSVPYCGFVIKAEGEKLLILAVNDDYINDAVDFVIDLITDSKLIIKSDYYYVEDAMDGNYPIADAMIGDIKLTDYSISTRKGDLGKILQKRLGEATGVCLPIVGNKAEGHLLVIGTSAKSDYDPLEYYEYRIESNEDDVHFFAYGDHEYGHAFKVFEEIIEASAAHSLVLSDTVDSYKLPAREEYIDDITKLYMLWDYLWEAPDWMLDYDDKKSSLFGGKGSDKLYASAHRAELGFYPENSIEAVISTYYMGAAIAELDFGATKDGVLVLLHDNTLDRTTNVADFIGKAGYPNSTNVADWTYEQLMDLNLKEGGGGANAKITPFKIATLEEALKICKNRLFIVPDKYANWQYVRSTNIMQDSKQIYLSDIMKKTNNFESILISYGKSSSSNYLSASDAVKLQQLLKTETGVTPFIMFRTSPDYIKHNFDYFTKNAEANSFALQINGDYRSSTNYAGAYSSHGDKVAFLAWTIGTGESWNDYLKNWQTMYKNGLRVIMTNDLFGLAQYCEQVGEKVMNSSK